MRTSARIAITATAILLGIGACRAYGGEAEMRTYWPANNAVPSVSKANRQDIYHDGKRPVPIDFTAFGIKSGRAEFELEQNGIIKYAEKLSIDNMLSSGNGVVRVSIDGEDLVSKDKYLPIREDFANVSLYSISKGRHGEKLRTLVDSHRVFVRLSDKLIHADVPIWTGPRMVISKEIETPRTYDPTIGQPDSTQPTPAQPDSTQPTFPSPSIPAAEKPVEKPIEPKKDTSSFMPIGM